MWWGHLGQGLESANSFDVEETTATLGNGNRQHLSASELAALRVEVGVTS